jgi:hypothetical protein
MWRQENCEFLASLSYVARSCLKKKFLKKGWRYGSSGRALV